MAKLMARYTIGSVPYVNAIPLVHAFESDDGPVRVVYDVPSALPARLATGEIQAMLVSSFFAVTEPDCVAVPGVCIGSGDQVESVRLFSKVPFDQIRRLALDASSMTSNMLARIILAESQGVHPELSIHPPDLLQMLTDCDAGVLIGDPGMMAPKGDWHVMDLGAAWRRWAGLPFVWALWVGRPDMPAELAELLAAQAPGARAGAGHWAGLARDRLELPMEDLQRYFSDSMDYVLDAGMEAGLQRFVEALRVHGFPDAQMPRWVVAQSGSAEGLPGGVARGVF